MIGKVTRGHSVARLLSYLYGPGRHNEHVNPHIVAGFRLPMALEPGLARGNRDFRHLVGVLTSPLDTLRHTPLASPVWQCSIRAAPTDRPLSDDEWADIAQEVMHQTGFAPRGDDQACRWIAVRHADDHIHLVTVLAREDGRNPSVHRDYFKVAKACHAIEERYGLTRTAPADRTAAPRPSRAETELAHRKNWPEPPRTALRRHVAMAAAGSETEDDFFATLKEAGVLVKIRHSVRTPGEITGYAVALPHHTNQKGQPVWFSGGKLAANLTLPKLRHRWSTPPDAHGRRAPRRYAPSGVELTHQERSAAYQQAARATATATWQMRHIQDSAVRADVAAATSDILHVTAAITGNRELAHAADFYDRAAREPYGRQPRQTPYGSTLRTIARTLARSEISARLNHSHRPSLTSALSQLIVQLAALIETVADLRQTQQRIAQAAAARKAAVQLTDLTRTRPRQPSPPLPAVIRPQTPNHNAARLAAADFPVPLSQHLATAPYQRPRTAALPPAPARRRPPSR
ncbi:relaxase [Actinomadura sp. WMMB 499]|uniref:relaxase/mobilization nuclease domain-containing protein n=1 Tax=Actinomadura sp. WMMB 499 TaxID=1219491 RepID=UPI001245FE5A|nr:relaxase [Actinomadura sp. WMMB 499]QFG26284.1 relaxase [Actinomadura sp. WMMB 499]